VRVSTVGGRRTIDLARCTDIKVEWHNNRWCVVAKGEDGLWLEDIIQWFADEEIAKDYVLGLKVGTS